MQLIASSLETNDSGTYVQIKVEQGALRSHLQGPAAPAGQAAPTAAGVQAAAGLQVMLPAAGWQQGRAVVG